MFKDAIFRTAIILSISAHAAVIMPNYFRARPDEVKIEKKIDLNYIIISEAELAKDKEIYTESGNKVSDVESVQDREPQSSIPEEVTDKIFTDRDDIIPEKAETDITPDLSEEKAFLEYYNILREKIRAELFSVIEKGDKCTATLYFTVAPDGTLIDINGLFPDTSSRIRKKVLRGARSAGPFPPFPNELGHSPATFSIVINIV